MSLAPLSGFVAVALILLISIWRGQMRAFTGFRKVFPVLALALLTFMVAPLHAQDKERTAVHKVPPVFPPIARQMGLSGTVIVTTTVDASGKVIKAESTSNSKLFVNAAIDAVKQWKFAPAESTDTFPITINFDK
jgi:TonB family protein